jgi:outer membrane protein assembly factor BamB
VTCLYSLQSNNKVANDNLVLVSAGRWIYAVSSTDGAILWEKEFSLDGYVLFCSVVLFRALGI